METLSTGQRKIEIGGGAVKPRVDLRLYRRLYSPFRTPPAEVVELVDALASGASGRKPVGVRVPPSACAGGCEGRWMLVEVLEVTSTNLHHPPQPRPPAVRSVPRQAWVDIHRPRVNSAAQAAHPRETRRLEDLQRLERTRPVMAVRHDLAMAVQLAEAGRQLGERNQHGAVDAGNLVLVRLAHVDHEQIGVLVPLLFQVLRRDLRALVRGVGPDAAERLVVDRAGDGGVGS